MGSLGVPALGGNQAPDRPHLPLWTKGDTPSTMLPSQNKAHGASASWGRAGPKQCQGEGVLIRGDWVAVDPAPPSHMASWGDFTPAYFR